MNELKRNDILYNIPITDATQERSMARVNQLVVFIDGGVPGDIADIQVYNIKKNFAEARLLKLVKPSPDRVEAFCSHFGTCGGCRWQHMSYEKQLFFKRKHIVENLERIAKIELPEISPMIGSSKTKYYRNRLDFACSNKRWLTREELGSEVSAEQNVIGFHVPGRFDKVIDLQTCYLQDDFSNLIRREIKSFADGYGMTFFDIVTQVGFLRNIIIRSTSTGEWMVIVVFHEDLPEARIALLNHLVKIFPSLTSLVYIINSKLNDTIYDLPVVLYYGRDHILEEMEGLKFKISAKSFYQTNSGQAYELYKIARSFAQLSGSELVYDLYTGTGTIANFISRQASRVIGIDNVADAIQDARENAIYNNITNTEFVAGDLKKTLTDEFISKHGKPKVIITDPPRAGMPGEVVRKIDDIRPDRVVYVSCNPATQARDLQILDEHYRLISVQPVDMFPHTTHVENVALLTLRS